ncbi:hypothetical protein CLV65_0925 [Pseudoscardovia suis]|uniref:Uncharacterized protein n=1 Tax=Pseudoscardovia suis TaxID=987063 RepID=A0A261F1N9_9BIFI|nr:hypothetical protein PSSU_0464 [Pseudoscardovia suis]PJJ68350.1 hypothetical protein CLV65_0925 [Pseudoscardovia suis]
MTVASGVAGLWQQVGNGRVRQGTAVDDGDSGSV